MTEAEIILQMIGSVDPADTANLNEIDARVWCYIQKATFLEMGGGTTFRFNVDGKSGHLNVCDKYTRSRDVLKELRPGWMGFIIKKYGNQSLIRIEAWDQRLPGVIGT